MGGPEETFPLVCSRFLPMTGVLHGPEIKDAEGEDDVKQLDALVWFFDSEGISFSSGPDEYQLRYCNQ